MQVGKDKPPVESVTQERKVHFSPKELLTLGVAFAFLVTVFFITNRPVKHTPIYDLMSAATKTMQVKKAEIKISTSNTNNSSRLNYALGDTIDKTTVEFYTEDLIRFAMANGEYALTMGPMKQKRALRDLEFYSNLESGYKSFIKPKKTYGDLAMGLQDAFRSSNPDLASGISQISLEQGTKLFNKFDKKLAKDKDNFNKVFKNYTETSYSDGKQYRFEYNQDEFTNQMRAFAEKDREKYAEFLELLNAINNSSQINQAKPLMQAITFAVNKDGYLTKLELGTGENTVTIEVLSVGKTEMDTKAIESEVQNAKDEGLGG